MCINKTPRVSFVKQGAELIDIAYLCLACLGIEIEFFCITKEYDFIICNFSLNG